jgi:3-carboxy-cis,cis-muconate cycloisomerase
MPARLIESLSTTEALAELFSDGAVVEAMLAFEVSLARAQARLGLVPQAAADAIAAAAKAQTFDAAMLARETLRAGTPGIPLVKAFTEQVRARDPGAAGFVHWGATSQDVADTALILLLKKAQPVLESDLTRLENGL